MSGSRVVQVLSAFVLMAGCGGGTTDPDPPPQNRSPVAAISVMPTEVPEGDGNQTVVTLDASGSTDPDGDPLTFNWAATSATFVNGTTTTSEVAQVTFPGNANYAITVTVSDGRGGTDQAQAVVTLGPPLNRVPTAVIAASPTQVPEGDDNQTVVTLDASGSSDPDGDPLTFNWAATSATFVNGTTATSEIAQVTFPGDDDYAVTLTVDDGRGGVGQAQTTIELGPPANANQAPTASLVASATQVPQNDQNRTVITLDASGSTDPENDPLTFAWAVDGGSFTNGTDATSQVAQVTFPGSRDHTVTLTVDDGQGNSDAAQQAITRGAIIERANPSFALDVQEVFQRRGCTAGGCHGFSPGSAGLDLRPANAFAELVGVPSTSEGIVRVIAGDADGSYLVIKLEGRQNVGLRMPRGGAPLNAVDLANIKNWINQGANNN